MDYLSAPIYKTSIQSEWLDYNNHMNVAYYLLIFDKAEELLFESLNLGEASAKNRGISWMVMENHITYERELSKGQEVEICLRLIDSDHKRVHLYLEMHTTGDESYLASTMEQMVICADLNKRKSAEFPDDAKANIQDLAQEQSNLLLPKNIGRSIGIRRK